MKEKLYYNAIMGKSHFIHEHIPERIENDPYIFLNPIFDEKKRSQRFYAQTAREFCKMGIPVINYTPSKGNDKHTRVNSVAPLLLTTHLKS